MLDIIIKDGYPYPSIAANSAIFNPNYATLDVRQYTVPCIIHVRSFLQFTILDRNSFCDLSYEVMFVEPEAHYKSRRKPFLVKSLTNAVRCHLNRKVIGVKHHSTVQRIDKQSFSCSSCPRTTYEGEIVICIFDMYTHMNTSKRTT